MKPLKSVLLIPLIFPVGAYADGLAWSLYVKAGNFTVEDPDGETEDVSKFFPGVKVTYPVINRNSQVAVGGDWIDFELETDGEEVAQKVDGYRIYGAYEYLVPFSRNTKLWAGAGLTLSDMSYEDRYTVDQDGYLAELYENRSEASMGSTFYLNLLFGRGSFVPGVGLFADLPFGDGVKAFGVTFSLNFD